MPRQSERAADSSSQGDNATSTRCTTRVSSVVQHPGLMLTGCLHKYLVYGVNLTRFELTLRTTGRVRARCESYDRGIVRTNQKDGAPLINPSPIPGSGACSVPLWEAGRDSH